MKGGRFEIARKAVKGSVHRLGPDAEFAVFGFNDQPFNISLWSTSHEAILAALGRVEPQGYTALYAAVSAAVDGLRGSRNRRQALVIVSDGNDQLRGERPTGAGVNLAARQRALSAIERVQHGEAVVFAIGVDAPDVPLCTGSTPPRSGVSPIRPAGRRVWSTPMGDRRSRGTHRRRVAPAVRDRIRACPSRRREVPQRSVTVKACACHVRARRGYVADKPKAP
jgi:hypothetical protein